MIGDLTDKIIREGYIFKKIIKKLEKTQYYTEIEMKNYQDERLRKIIRHAYDTVPYYKELFDKNNIVPKDIKTQEDLYNIPILTKDDIKNNFQKLVSTKVPKTLMKIGETSGTTGSPLRVYRDLYSIIFENAIVWRQWRWAGIKLGDNIAILRGERIIPQEITQSPFWIYSKFSKRLKLSPLHLTDETVFDYIDAIKKYNCKALQAYPASAYMLALYCKKNNIKLRLKAVFTSSEPLHPFQRDTIEETFGCKVWDYYGMGERVCCASECQEHSGILHLNEEYGITEFLDKENINRDKGVITGTTLHNYAMPLIRYKTGDMGELSKVKCSCNKTSKVIKPIETKYQDIMLTKEGRYIAPVTITNTFRTCKNIKESQIIQNTLESYEIRIVEDGIFTDDDKDELKRKMHAVLGYDCDINVKLVPSIPRTENGKFRMILSNVKKDE